MFHLLESYLDNLSFLTEPFPSNAFGTLHLLTNFIAGMQFWL